MRAELPLATRSAWLVRSAGLVVRLALIWLVVVLTLLGLLTVLAGRAAPVTDLHAGRAPSLAAESFAEAFTRAYLSWDPAHPERHERRVGAYASEALAPGAGLSARSGSSQQVTWTAAVQDEVVSNQRRLITVAAETTSGPSFVSVPVQTDRRGFMAVSGYPAFVGAPPVNTKAPVIDEPQVVDRALRTVAGRAIANYLRREGTNLRADLDRRAVVALPTRRLRIASLDSITWVRRGRVAVELRAEEGGATWTLRYELEVVKRDRWYVRSIQVNPNVRRSP